MSRWSFISGWPLAQNRFFKTKTMDDFKLQNHKEMEKDQNQKSALVWTIKNLVFKLRPKSSKYSNLFAYFGKLGFCQIKYEKYLKVHFNGILLKLLLLLFANKIRQKKCWLLAGFELWSSELKASMLTTWPPSPQPQLKFMTAYSVFQDLTEKCWATSASNNVKALSLHRQTIFQHRSISFGHIYDAF